MFPYVVQTGRSFLVLQAVSDILSIASFANVWVVKKTITTKKPYSCTSEPHNVHQMTLAYTSSSLYIKCSQTGPSSMTTSFQGERHTGSSAPCRLLLHVFVSLLDISWLSSLQLLAQGQALKGIMDIMKPLCYEPESTQQGLRVRLPKDREETDLG